MDENGLIGRRLDHGDAGVVYLTKDQARAVVNTCKTCFNCEMMRREQSVRRMWRRK